MEKMLYKTFLRNPTFLFVELRCCKISNGLILQTFSKETQRKKFGKLQIVSKKIFLEHRGLIIFRENHKLSLFLEKMKHYLFLKHCRTF